MNPNDTHVKISFPTRGVTAELEVSTPSYSNAAVRMWTALAGLRVIPLSAYVVRNDTRVVAHVKLTEFDGAPLSQGRATEILGTLQRKLGTGPDSLPWSRTAETRLAYPGAGDRKSA